MKSYEQYCGVAKALDVVGGRWTLLIVRELLPGPRRYSELRSGLPGITTNMLADRLKELREAGVTQVLEDRRWGLTPLGFELKPVVLSLGRFGSKWLGAPAGEHLNPRWMMVSLQRRYTGGVGPLELAVTVEGSDYRVVVTPDSIDVSDGASPNADARIRGTFPEVGALLGRGLFPVEGLSVVGDEAALLAFVQALR